MNRSFLDRALGGEEHPTRLWVLLAILALCLHVLAAQRLFRSEEIQVEPKPLPPMDVSLVAAEAPQPVAAPTPPPPPPPPKKAEPPKPKPLPPKPKPVKKIVKPAEPKPELPKREVAPAREETPEPPPPAPASPVHSEAPPVERPARTEPRPAAVAPVTQASFNAAYLHNPKPAYPAAARQRGWEGTVKLRVRVSAGGEAEQVDIQQSSGYDLLDESALEAVRQWRFIPAKRGETPIASSVVVPLAFHLSK